MNKTRITSEKKFTPELLAAVNHLLPQLTSHATPMTEDALRLLLQTEATRLYTIRDEQDRIMGCHLYGENAAFIAQEVAVLMNFGATLTQLGEIVHTHPTLSEILQDMAFMP